MKKNTSKKDENNDKNSENNSYNEFKEFHGVKYTGMKIGRSHTWHYDQGEWKEKKQTPDLWEFNYNVTKRRAGHAPEGSGVPVGTEYHWYILAHQNVRKIDANTYTTAMRGFKYKIAHKRADKEAWSASYRNQRKRLIKLFQSILHQLEQEELEDKKNSRKRTKKRSVREV
jgi:hypothetical protein